MGTTERTIEGVSGVWDYHYDVTGDVLYVALASKVAEPAFGEETDEGYILFRSMTDDTVVGMTVVHFLRRFGLGARGDLMRADVEKALVRFLDGLDAPPAREIALAAMAEYEANLPEAVAANA